MAARAKAGFGANLLEHSFSPEGTKFARVSRGSILCQPPAPSLLDDVAQMNADAKLDAAVGRQAGVAMRPVGESGHHRVTPFGHQHAVAPNHPLPSGQAASMALVEAVLAQASVHAGLEMFLRSEASRTARQFPDFPPALSFPD
jgi:hypothetical protein